MNDQYMMISLIISIILLLLATLISLLIWRNRKRFTKVYAKIKNQNNNLKVALTALEQSQEENMRIMKVVAHDLRSPMSITIGIVNIILENKNLLPSDLEMLEMMKTANLNALEMIVDLLNLNITKTGLKKEPTEMHILLQQCVDLLNIKALNKKQYIVLKSENIVLDISGDKMWRVINNLIVNAIKFSPVGSEINVELYQKNKVCYISIQDQGIGIPETLKSKIFDVFTNAKRLGTAGEASFGLGLSIAKQIVEAHDGQITFVSEVNKGSKFLIALPICQ